MSRYRVQVFTDDSNVKEWEDLTPDKINHIEFKGKWFDEVRHGRWKETTTLNLWECSVCGQMIYSETVLDRKAFHKWCGRCGARMDGEQNG